MILAKILVYSILAFPVCLLLCGRPTTRHDLGKAIAGLLVGVTAAVLFMELIA